MNGSGIAIFIIFFGLATLEAIRGGHWMRATFWIAIGIAFWALDRSRRRLHSAREPRRTDV